MSNVDWVAAENLLVREAEEQFPKLAAAHPDDEFYGVFFDCDVVYTTAQAHMNTNAHLRQYAERCQRGNRGPSGSPMYPGLSIEQVMEELRWDGGGWGQFGIFPGPNFEEVVTEHKRLCAEVGAQKAEQSLKEDFMLMACRAVVRIDSSGVFEQFRRTKDFRVLCVYIHESVEEGDRRLQQVREATRLT